MMEENRGMDRKKIAISLEASKIEIAKRLKGLRDIMTSEEQYEVLLKSLLPQAEQAAVEQAIKGLSEEDEFVVLSQAMGTATQFVPLGQAPIVKGDTITPDLLACFKPGCYLTKQDTDALKEYQCLIEVKSISKTPYKIGGSVLRRLRNFARNLKLPLLLAVRFTGFSSHAVWVIVDASDEQETSLIIDLSRHLLHGVRHVLWNEYILMLFPGIILERVYDMDARTGECYNSDYGELLELRIRYKDKVQTYQKPAAVAANCFFRCFSDQTWHLEQQGRRLIEITTAELHFCFLADLLYRFNKMIKDEAGEVVYNASRIVAQADLADPPFVVTRDKIECMIAQFVAEGFIGLVSVGDDQDHIAQWRRMGGKTL